MMILPGWVGSRRRGPALNSRIAHSQSSEREIKIDLLEADREINGVQSQFFFRPGERIQSPAIRCSSIVFNAHLIGVRHTMCCIVVDLDRAIALHPLVMGDRYSSSG